MVCLSDIQDAYGSVKDRVLRTPLIFSPNLSQRTGAQVYLKLENLQRTGSFKLRGATYKIRKHLQEIGPEGVVAASAGNHAQGVALAARDAGLPATIIMPDWASISKQEATRNYGGEVILAGQSMEESIETARELARAGRTFIHPFNDSDIIAGQGTIGLEILEDLPEPDLVIAPIGGGGLVSGIAVAVKSLRPKTRVVGVQAAACPSAYQARREREVVRVEARRSIADGIALKEIGEITFPIIQENVDEIVLVEEDQIAAAILMLLERKKILAEGAGAVSLAALLGGAVAVPAGSRVVLVISGGNVDSPLLDRIIRQGLFRKGRIMRFSVRLDDVPGALARLLALVAAQQANVIHIHHDRIGRDMPVHGSRVELELETRGPVHIKQLMSILEEAGYQLEM